MNTDQVIEKLKSLAGIFEASHVNSFRCVRTRPDGQTQDVQIEIHDAGPRPHKSGNPRLRYYAVAIADGGKHIASGNPGPTVEDVLATLHWFDLDK